VQQFYSSLLLPVYIIFATDLDRNQHRQGKLLSQYRISNRHQQGSQYPYGISHDRQQGKQLELGYIIPHHQMMNPDCRNTKLTYVSTDAQNQNLNLKRPALGTLEYPSRTSNLAFYDLELRAFGTLR
jgi:hypothetical protein